MPTQFEDTQAGATDISGQPDPVRTPKQLGDQTRKQANQNERRPQPQKQDKNPLQQAADDVGGAGKAVGDAVKGAGQAVHDAGFAQPTKSLNPVDWAKEMQQDASVPWGWARSAYKTLSGDYNDGVHGLFAGNSAYDKVGQQAAGFLADSIPLVGLQESFSNLQSLEQEREGKLTDPQRKQQEGQHEEQAVQQAPGTAATDVSLAAPGGRLASTAVAVGIPLVESLLGGDQNEQNSALAWAAFGSILSYAHLPEPLKKVLQDHFGDITAFESVANAVQSKLKTSRNFQDPAKRFQQVSDWIDEQLSRGGLPSGSKVVARARKPGEAQRVQAEVSPEGEIKLLPSESRAATKKLLNRIGVEDVDELVHKAQTEGINDPKLVKAITNNWKDLGIPYDLQRFHPDEQPLRDPRVHLDTVADMKAGQQHVAAVTHYLDQIHRGLFANHSNPMTAVLRALAGHSRTTQVTHQQYMSSMVKLLGSQSLTEAVAHKLMQAAEGDMDVYQALRPEEKMVVDGWGLLRAAAREESKGTDYAQNFVPNWVPRRDKDVEGMLRGPGRPSTASVLAREARLHREESLQAMRVDTPPPAYQGYKPLDPKLSPEEAASAVNARTLYHGTSEAGLKAENIDPFQTNPTNLYGYGFYATDRPETAMSYAGKAGSYRARGNRQLYRMQTQFSKVLDAERPMLSTERTLLGDALQKYLKSAGNIPTDLGEMFDKLMAKPNTSAADLYSFVWKEVIPQIDSNDPEMVSAPLDVLNDALRHAGYDAIAHEGGKTTNAARHQAVAMIQGRSWGAGGSSGGPALSSFGLHEPSQQRLVLGQRFRTVDEANQALASARSNLVATLTESDKELSAELQNDPAAKAIRALARTDPAAALEQAKTLAAQKYADKDTNFLKNVNAAFASQVRAVHTHQALNEFTQMLAKDGKAAAIKLRPGAQRQREEFLRQGYKQIDDPRFQGHVFHPDLANALNRYVNHVRAPEGTGAQIWDLALKLEGKVVAAIMFSPMVHGLNVAGRMGIGALMHPIQMTKYLKEGKAILPHQWDDTSWALRSEAYNAGLIPHYRGKSYADNALSQMQDALGDVEDQLPNMTKQDSTKARMSAMWDQVARPHRAVNNYFWGLVNDYGVMMYHLEKTSAQRAGLGDEAAMEYAARRANTWMGMVAPEDRNPQWHNLSRLVMFAPNWWRTWAELMVPLYKRSGFASDPAYTKFAAAQSAKTISAALAFQKLSGNAMNYLLSGHLQNENQPGNQDRIEATAPWLDHLPGFSGVAATDPKTGARRTVENPLARQQQATEMAMGLQSGHPDYKPEDTWDGLAKFLSARTSPLLDSALGALNVDLYQSIADHQFRAVDPTEPAGQLSPANLLYGAIMMTPIGLNFSQQVGRNAAAGDTNPVESALGTKVPVSLQEAVKDIGDPAGRTMFSWITGINPPYDTAQKSRGVKPSDQDYQRAKLLGQQYQQRMTTLSAEAMSGQMTPAQWRTAYADQSRQHAAQMEALFQNSPEYVNGGEGLAAQWEHLYTQATNQDGTLDQDKLSVLQAQFHEDHTPQQLQQMNAILSQNDSKYPMLGLYHRTQAQFDQWQQQWATQNNVDIGTLRKDLSSYSALYGDAQGSRHFLAQHPELRRYETEKHTQFDRTVPGALHAMFYGNSATLMQYLRAHHLTAAQFAAQEAGVTGTSTP